jgi:hypothetical protein
MPTIPTFTAKGTPTTEVGSVRSNIKVNPRESMAAALAPVGKVAEDYYVQQRENSDNLEYNKILLEIRAETDIAVNLQKDNPNVEEALANVKLQQDSILANKLSKTNNRRVRNKLKTGAALEGYKANYKVQIASSLAFEKDSIEVYNNNANQLIADIKTTDNLFLNVQYRQQLFDNAKKFNTTFTLGEDDLKNRIKNINRVLFFIDSEDLIGTENAVSDIAKLDKRTNGNTLLPDEIFNKQLYDSYAQKIESVAIKGDPNSDYEEAERLLDELQILQRGDGSKVVSGPREKSFAILKEKTLTESINHDAFVLKTAQGAKFFKYQTEEKKLLKRNFFNRIDSNFNKPVNEERALQAEREYESRIDSYLSSIEESDTDTEEVSLFAKQQFARQLRFNLIDKYKNIEIDKLTAFNSTENKFNVVREKADVIALFEQYKANPEAENSLKTIAKLNGFVDEKENITLSTMNDLMDKYMPILEEREQD